LFLITCSSKTLSLITCDASINGKYGSNVSDSKYKSISVDLSLILIVAGYSMGL